ncbi:MAG: ABC transporter permease, partial [Alphaproteobacteria bacterium]
MSRAIRRHGWALGLSAMLVLLLVLTKIIQPNYGASGIGSLARAALPFAFATASQVVVVIVGGIDLSIASMMSVASVTAAVLMDGASEEFSILVVMFVLLLGLVMGAINGALVVATRVPDIVVTLAMLFVWEGVALLILRAPGGAAAAWLKASIVGTVGIPGIPVAITDWIPKALVVLAICLCVVWLPLIRSRLGLAVYAVGSD